MKVLYLGPFRNDVTSIMEATGDTIEHTEEPINAENGGWQRVDFIVSFGYRHILSEEVLRRFPERAINLHISLLPWNRGSDPNLWSFLEDSPKGVTIHLVDAGVDTGPILAQEEVAATQEDTLRTSYARLECHLVQLFAASWKDIRLGRIRPRPQIGQGSYHRVRDKEQFSELLTAGWDTPVARLTGKARTLT